MIPDWLLEIKNAVTRATPGKWVDWNDKRHVNLSVICAVARGPQHRVYTEHIGGTYPFNDLIMIKLARNELPRLIRIAEAAALNIEMCGDCGGTGIVDTYEEDDTTKTTAPCPQCTHLRTALRGDVA